MRKLYASITVLSIGFCCYFVLCKSNVLKTSHQRVTLAPTRLANDARASSASRSGKSQGEASPLCSTPPYCFQLIAPSAHQAERDASAPQCHPERQRRISHDGQRDPLLRSG